MNAPLPSSAVTERIMRWLLDHPGEHKPADIAQDMGLTTHVVASRLLYLSGQGRLLRRRTSRSRSLYSHPTPN